MSNKRLFSRDNVLGITRWFHYNPETDQFAIETVQDDVSPIVEANKASFAMTDERARFGESATGMHLVASIPLAVYEKLVVDGIAKDQKAMKRWLDAPENRVFRTRPGKLSK